MILTFLRLFILPLIFSAVSPIVLNGQTQESLIKAGYIEKFTHFVKWPAQNPVDPQQFIIAVLGEDNISQSLNDIFKKSKEYSDFRIIKIKDLQQLKNCNILFISGSEKNEIDKILTSVSGQPILTIGDTKGYGEKGVIINLFQEGDYIRYEVNKRSLDRSGLQINSMLLNYAILIGTGGK